MLEKAKALEEEEEENRVNSHRREQKQRVNGTFCFICYCEKRS